MFKKHLYVSFALLFVFLQGVIIHSNVSAAITLITPQMRLAQVGEVFVDNLTVTSTVPLVSVAVSGSPAGIVAVQNGKGDIAFSGLPTVAGSYPITLSVRNSAEEIQSFIVKLVVHGVLSGVTQIVGSDIKASDGRRTNGFYCAIADGGLSCWGNNSRGNLGNGSINLAIAAEQIIAPKSGVTRVAVGGNSACAVINAGLQCWGAISDFIDLAAPRNIVSNPAQVNAFKSNVVDVSAKDSGNEACAGMSSGTPCSGVVGKFIIPSTPLQNLLKPVQVIPFNGDVADVSVNDSGNEACAVIAGGVQCWVSVGNAFAPPFGSTLGDGIRRSVQRIPAGSGVTKLRSKAGLTCAVIRGSLQCWGRSFPISSDDPTQITDDVIMGSGLQGEYFCIAANGGVRCQNDFSVNALGLPRNQLRQVIPEKSGVTQLLGEDNGVCVVINGALWCWGYLRALPFASPLPIVARGAEQKITDMAMSNNSVCIVADTKPRCYGVPDGGVLGNRIGAINANFSSVVAAGSGVTDANLSLGQACIVKNGGVFCSSNDALTNLPNLNAPASLKQIISEGSGATKLSLETDGGFPTRKTSACAVVAGGVQCWGANAAGALGDGTTLDSAQPVRTIPASSGATAVAVSLTHACAIVDAGLQCWGEELGLTSKNRNATSPDDATDKLSLTPQWVVGFGQNVSSVLVGQGYTCALQFTSVFCWGTNTNNYFNNGSSAPSARPVSIRLNGERFVALSDYHAFERAPTIANGYSTALGKRLCALDEFGAVICWGGTGGGVGLCGILGNVPCGSFNHPETVVLARGSGVQSIVNSCGVGQGLLKCWSGSFQVVRATAAFGAGISALVPNNNAYNNSSANYLNWSCAVTGGGLSCFFADGTFPRPVSTEYFAATAVSALPNETPDRKPWFRAVATPNELFVLTNNPNEYATLAADTARYIAQGYVFSVANKASTVNGAIAWPFYRLYRRDTQQRLWTSSFAEYQQMRTNTAQFIDEGSDGYVYKQANVAGTVPLYRFKRRNTGYEVLTTNLNEVQFFTKAPNWELLRDTSDATLGDAIGYVWP